MQNASVNEFATAKNHVAKKMKTFTYHRVQHKLMQSFSK